LGAGIGGGCTAEKVGRNTPEKGGGRGRGVKEIKGEKESLEERRRGRTRRDIKKWEKQKYRRVEDKEEIQATREKKEK